MPLDPAIAALAGTGLGAVLGGASAWLVERARWHRQLSTRWDEIKLGRYAELFFMIDEFFHLSGIAKLHDGHYSQGEDIARLEELAEDWKRAAKQVSSIGARLNELEIIASPVVSRAANDWWRAARAYEDAGRDNRLLYRKLEFAKQVFVEAAKKELLDLGRRRRFSTKSHGIGLEAVDVPLRSK